MSCTAPVGGGDGVVVNEVAMVSDNAAMAAGALSSFLSCTHAGCSAWLSYQKTRGTSVDLLEVVVDVAADLRRQG